MQTPIREIMATTSKDTSIRIKESTRFRLDMLKGNKSHDAFVAEMLLYFETTGITPQSNVMPPNIAAKEQASRVIEVVRGIEKSTNVRLKNIEQLLLSLVGEVKTPGDNPDEYMHICKYSINSLVYWVTYVHNVVYSFYRSMIYCYINSTQRCAGSIVIDIIPTNGADKRKFFPFAPYFPVTNVIKRYFYPYFPAIIGIKGYSFPYFPYLSGIMKIKTALYSLFSRLDWHKTVVFPCLGEIYEGIRSLSWEIPVT